MWRARPCGGLGSARARPSAAGTRARADDSDVGVEGVGETLLRFVESFCLFGGEAAPPLCRARAPLAARARAPGTRGARRKILGVRLTRGRRREGAKTNEKKKNDDEKEKAAVRFLSVEQATLLELAARARRRARCDPLVKGRD